MILPLNNRVLVEVIEDTAPTAGGFEVAGERDRKDRPLKGKIVQVIQEPTDKEGMILKPGDTVLFAPYGYDEVVEGGKVYALVPNDLLLGLWTKDD